MAITIPPEFSAPIKFVPLQFAPDLKVECDGRYLGFVTEWRGGKWRATQNLRHRLFGTKEDAARWLFKVARL